MKQERNKSFAKQLAKAKNGPRLLIISNDPRHAKTLLDLNVE